VALIGVLHGSPELMPQATFASREAFLRSCFHQDKKIGSVKFSKRRRLGTFLEQDLIGRRIDNSCEEWASIQMLKRHQNFVDIPECAAAVNGIFKIVNQMYL
jgi:hypothetical protein